MYSKTINLPKGRRLTRSKQMIMDYFSNHHGHFTTEKLYIEIKKQLPQLGLATVYRNLNDLVGLGVLKQLSYPGMPVAYELSNGHHAHFYCEYCHNIYDVEIPGKSIDCNRAWQGHYIKDVNIELKGICKNCTTVYFG